MPNELIIIDRGNAPARRGEEHPALVVQSGPAAAQAWTDFFDGKVRNRHTCKLYKPAVRHFLLWCEGQGLELHRIMAGTSVQSASSPRFYHCTPLGCMRQRLLRQSISRRAAVSPYVLLNACSARLSRNAARRNPYV